MTSPKTALIQVRVQTNGSISITAPNGDVSIVSKKGKDAVTQVGASVLAILADPNQPEGTVTPPKNVPGDAPGDSDGSSGEERAEQRVRGILDDFIPGGSRALDFLQELSKD